MVPYINVTGVTNPAKLVTISGLNDNKTGLFNGYPAIIVVILSALFGTFIYGLLRSKLPH